MKCRYEELAGMIDHALLHPTLTDSEIRVGCKMAAEYRVASVCVKPYAVHFAREILRDSDVAVGTVIGFPHGSPEIAIKQAETALACDEGATEIDFVINIGKALSEDWGYIEKEVRAVSDEAHRHGALVKVIFETTFFPLDSSKVRLCRISEDVGADFVKTSTGFDFVKSAGGGFATVGATEHDLRLMRASCSPRVQVKASGGVRNLDALLAVKALGATRCGTSATREILDEFRRRERGEGGIAVADAGGGY